MDASVSGDSPKVADMFWHGIILEACIDFGYKWIDAA